METNPSNELYLRKVSLLLVEGSNALDLSDFHIIFDVQQEDQESPNNARIRVHNLAPDLVKRIKGEYSRVVLQAGYQQTNYGVIFDGTIKQWGEGRENDRVNTFLDILAADGDQAYNFAYINKSLNAGSTPEQRLEVLFQAMGALDVTRGTVVPQANANQTFGGTLPRGKVFWGLARTHLRSQVENLGATWSIQNGKINIIPLEEYLPGQAVVLNSLTGLVGRPEQTQEGVLARALINPRIGIGNLVKIDQASVNRVSQHSNSVIPVGQLPYDKRVGVQYLADVSADGLYRVYVIKYQGDTKATPWWMDLILLSVDPSTNKVKAYG